MDIEIAKNTVRLLVKQAHEDAEAVIDINDDTALIGNKSLLDSMALVQLCLALEDKASNFGFEFDWTSDDAMSKSKGMYRSVKALSEEFFNQYSQKK